MLWPRAHTGPMYLFGHGEPRLYLYCGAYAAPPCSAKHPGGGGALTCCMPCLLDLGPRFPGLAEQYSHRRGEPSQFAASPLETIYHAQQVRRGVFLTKIMEPMAHGSGLFFHGWLKKGFYARVLSIATPLTGEANIHPVSPRLGLPLLCVGNVHFRWWSPRATTQCCCLPWRPCAPLPGGVFRHRLRSFMLHVERPSIFGIGFFYERRLQEPTPSVANSLRHHQPSQ